MSDDERLERLEHRVTALESLVRQAVSERTAAGERPRAAPQKATPKPRAAPKPRSPLITEEWIGQRGLLAVGVTALVLAAAYLLKLSFERGWVAPLLRCIGGAAGGLLVGGLGWRLVPRYRTYGAALVGCGAAIVYLAVWAACTRYALLAPVTAIAGLVLVSLALAAIAYALDVEALGMAAAVGAFVAPLTIETQQRNPDVLLLYLFCMGAALGIVAAHRRWRVAAAVVAASFFGLGGIGGADAAPVGALAYGVIGGTAGLFLGLREHWWETRALSFWGGWAIMREAGVELASPFPLLAAALVMAAPVWWHGLRFPRLWPAGQSPRIRGFEWSAGEALYFFVTPLFVGWALYHQAPAAFDAEPGLAALIIAVPYLCVGYLRPRPAFALVGMAALATAMWLHWPGTGAVIALALLAILAAGLDHRLGRTDGRWYALAALVGALWHLMGTTFTQRTDADPAFAGEWALALWTVAGAAAALAAGVWKRVAGEDAQLGRPVVGFLWIMAGGLVLFGVTAEIGRFFVQRTMAAETANLGRGLAVSAWWLLFAVALVLMGFARSLPAARQAGLAVATLALIKVVAFDLASLDALYRVGSVLILGCVSLSIAYLYHRRARADAP